MFTYRVINDSISYIEQDGKNIICRKDKLFDGDIVNNNIIKSKNRDIIHVGLLNTYKTTIYGKNKKFFNKELQGKIKHENFNNLNDALKKVFVTIKKHDSIDQTILFSPSAASFDSFKNFEDRGHYFNKLIKKYLNGKQNINI